MIAAYCCRYIIFQYVYISFSMPLGILYVLVGLHSDKPGPVCPDLGAWSEEDPSLADQAYLKEQAAFQ